jgi:hypothetical protein
MVCCLILPSPLWPMQARRQTCVYKWGKSRNDHMAPMKTGVLLQLDEKGQSFLFNKSASAKRKTVENEQILTKIWTYSTLVTTLYTWATFDQCTQLLKLIWNHDWNVLHVVPSKKWDTARTRKLWGMSYHGWLVSFLNWQERTKCVVMRLTEWCHIKRLCDH